MAFKIEATYNVPEAGLLRILGAGADSLLEVAEAGTGGKMFEAFELFDDEERPIGWAVDVDTEGHNNRITLRMSYTAKSCSWLFSCCDDLVCVDQLEAPSGICLRGMFFGCANLERVSPTLPTERVADFSNAFAGCRSLKHVAQFSMAAAVYYYRMWEGANVPEWARHLEALSAQNKLFRKSGL